MEIASPLSDQDESIHELYRKGSKVSVSNKNIINETNRKFRELYEEYVELRELLSQYQWGQYWRQHII